MDKKTHGPKLALSCESCEYHEVNGTGRSCKAKSVTRIIPTTTTTTGFASQNGYYIWAYRTPIDLLGNETPDWCPLLPKGEEKNV